MAGREPARSRRVRSKAGVRHPAGFAASVARTQAWLPTHADLDARIYEGLGHSISERELGDLVAWLGARYA